MYTCAKQRRSRFSPRHCERIHREACSPTVRTVFRVRFKENFHVGPEGKQLFLSLLSDLTQQTFLRRARAPVGTKEHRASQFLSFVRCFLYSFPVTGNQLRFNQVQRIETLASTRPSIQLFIRLTARGGLVRSCIFLRFFSFPSCISVIVTVVIIFITFNALSVMGSCEQADVLRFSPINTN